MVSQLFTVPRVSFILTVCILFSLALNLIYNNPDEKFRRNLRKYGRRDIQNFIVRSIQVRENYGRCVFPYTLTDAQGVYQPDRKTTCKRRSCRSKSGWVLCSENKCYIRKSLTESKGKIDCVFTDIIRTSDRKVGYGIPHRNFQQYLLNCSDFVKVQCNASNGDRWAGDVIGTRPILVPKSREDKPRNDKFNVLILSLDSLTKTDFLQKLPKTYWFLKQQLGAVEFRGFNTIGNSRSQNLIAMLTGQTELELPDTRKASPRSSHLDVHPMIWKTFRNDGYIISFNEDSIREGVLNSQHKDFLEQPTDHYLHTYVTEKKQYFSNNTECCFSNYQRHQILFDYTNKILSGERNKSKFILNVHDVTSSDNLFVLDHDIFNFLFDLQEKEALSRTIFILVSNTDQPLNQNNVPLEEKLNQRILFASVVLPLQFQKQFPQEYSNFQNNTNSLITSFDIHATLEHVLQLQNNQSEGLRSCRTRSISLFKQIPHYRSCAHAHIEPHLCSCLGETPININRVILMGAENIVDTVNTFLEPYWKFCRSVTLSGVIDAVKLAPQKALLQYKKLDDVIGYIPNLSGSTIVRNEWYQIQVAINASTEAQSIIEGIVRHDLWKDIFETKIKDIVLKEGGIGPHCLAKVGKPMLKKLCICKEIN